MADFDEKDNPVPQNDQAEHASAPESGINQFTPSQSDMSSAIKQENFRKDSSASQHLPSLSLDGLDKESGSDSKNGSAKQKDGDFKMSAESKPDTGFESGTKKPDFTATSSSELSKGEGQAKDQDKVKDKDKESDGSSNDKEKRPEPAEDGQPAKPSNDGKEASKDKDSVPPLPKEVTPNSKPGIEGKESIGEKGKDIDPGFEAYVPGTGKDKIDRDGNPAGDKGKDIDPGFSPKITDNGKDVDPGFEQYQPGLDKDKVDHEGKPRSGEGKGKDLDGFPKENLPDKGFDQSGIRNRLNQQIAEATRKYGSARKPAK